MSTSLNLKQVRDGIKLVLKQFNTPERLSDFEKGQADGLRWALDVIETIESPDEQTTILDEARNI